MNILPLGTNGFFSSFCRQTACFAIPRESRLIILDAGSGLFRLAEPEGKKLLAGVANIHLFLSHYHLDHTFGFYAAFQLLKGKHVSVFAPSGRQVFSEFVTLKHFPVDYSQVYKNFKWKSLHEGVNTIENYKVSVRKQYHRGEGSLAFRFDFGLGYVTDSEPTQESVDFVKDLPVLLHEHEVSSKDTSIPGKKLEDFIDGGHVTTVGAALIAKQAKVGKLYLIHHSPFVDMKKLEKQLQVARKIFPKTELAKELKKITF